MTASPGKRGATGPLPRRQRSWYDRAACRGMDTRGFFPDRGDHAGIAAAKVVCAGCPVRVECFAEAIGTEPPHDHGVRGATTREERQAIRAGRLAVAAVWTGAGVPADTLAAG